jgi:thiamine monophosphate kinase
LSGARVERRLAAFLSRLRGDDAGTLAPLADVAHAVCDVSDELVAGLGHSCDAGVGVVIDMPALLITATGAIERKAGVRLVDAGRKRVPMTASGWQHV